METDAREGRRLGRERTPDLIDEVGGLTSVVGLDEEPVALRAEVARHNGAAEPRVVAEHAHGRDVDEVEADLQDLGLNVRRDEQTNPGDEQEDSVEGVDPSGTLQEGDTVTVSYWGPPPTEQQPPTTPPGQEKKP